MPDAVHSDADRALMRRALALAERGLLTATPNPRVGCVIVGDGAVIGEGWHERAGEPHAEANALAQARAKGCNTRGATLYATLEPCNHTGRTPPCTEAIVAAGIARVVAAMADPNPQASRGAQRLRAAGIAVDIGLEAEAARELNIGFVSRMTRGLPWVRVKAAASIDGRTALENGKSRWITGEAARADGHRFRARSCAVLTGSGTVLADDPELTVRAIETPRQPLRVVVDAHAETPPSAKVLSGAAALVFTAGARNPGWPSTAEVVSLPDAQGKVDLAQMLRLLADRGVNELHVEAGAGLVGAFAAAGLVDEWLFYVAPALIGDPARGVARRPEPLADLSGRFALAFTSIDRIGEDLRILARTRGVR
jgi:diaminohydroxyphosphoribosylaminopyrimidine deaminase / 5-amino-6-(5-phosphoribosylamino)uracil reductase